MREAPGQHRFASSSASPTSTWARISS